MCSIVLQPVIPTKDRCVSFCPYCLVLPGVKHLHDHVATFFAARYPSIASVRLVIFQPLIDGSSHAGPSAELRNQQNQTQEIVNTVVADWDRYAVRPRICIVDSLVTTEKDVQIRFGLTIPYCFLEIALRNSTDSSHLRKYS